MICPAALALIESFEKLALSIYDDGYGYPTIGWGHLILPGEDWSHGITRYQADELLQHDLAKAERGVQVLCPASLTANQYGALASFAFNAGVATLQRSTFRQALLRGEIDEVPSGLLLYCKAGRPLKTSRGLLRRRQAEAQLFLS